MSKMFKNLKKSLVSIEHKRQYLIEYLKKPDNPVILFDVVNGEVAFECILRSYCKKFFKEFIEYDEKKFNENFENFVKSRFLVITEFLINGDLNYKIEKFNRRKLINCMYDLLQNSTITIYKKTN